MAPKNEPSALKRARASAGESSPEDKKKPRRSERLARDEGKGTPITTKGNLPSPITNQESTAPGEYKEVTATPEERPQTPEFSVPEKTNLSSPIQDTQAFSQFTHPKSANDEEEEGVLGYLISLTDGNVMTMYLEKAACPNHGENEKNGVKSAGFLCGRHPENDMIIDDPTISNRHFVIFGTNKGGTVFAVLQDSSSNGTFVNDSLVGRNKRRELHDSDEITLPNRSRFLFKYPQYRDTSQFHEQYDVIEKLGKGHFAEVYLCVEKATGQRYAVKIFTKGTGAGERSKTDGLEQEIAVLMGVSHPNLLCLKDTFDEKRAVYLVLELAAEGELFNAIVMKQKLSVEETRHVFKQLFEGMKYLHDRNIVHRDIKPENILLTDKNLSIKIADFGLAKIIGEESFTTTLCGTPSYVAPEILSDSKHRRYTRAVDVWSLGVVLYICLCGFPPFSDELYSKEAPYTLHDQIKMGRFDYPSPYWDSVPDSALELIDAMLTVDAAKRPTVEECMVHPFMLEGQDKDSQRVGRMLVNPNDSTGGLVGGIQGLDFDKRRIERERTLLASINTVLVAKKIELERDGKDAPVAVFVKNPGKERLVNKPGGAPKENGKPKEVRPDEGRRVEEFEKMGGKGDEVLFGDDPKSNYPSNDVARAKKVER